MKPTEHLSQHFRASELACKCCGSLGSNDGESLKKTALFLERVRTFLGNRAITVNSGYRCPKHNKAVGGEPNSFHMRAYAADITVAGMTPKQVQAKLDEPGSPVTEGGLGSYATFTHVDRRGYHARWSG